jgi:hypothetical protein
MKVLFLDVDGVLNCSKRWKGSHAIDLDEECLDNLVHILTSVEDLKIVLSSTWRLYGSDCAGLMSVFEELGIADRCIDKTPDYTVDSKPRWIEIRDWLQSNPQVTELAILDDCESAGHGFCSKFFRTTMSYGLTRKIANKIVAHFKREIPCSDP